LHLVLEASVQNSAGRSCPRAHLIGVAGSGMRSLARVLVERGWQVSGTDAKFAGMVELGVARATANLPMSPVAMLAEVDQVIYSDAIPPDHPERLAAAQLGIEAINYPQMLGRLMSKCQTDGGMGLAVAGTHGKSTTTAIAAEILHSAEIHATSIFGAEFQVQSMVSRATYDNAIQPAQRFLVEACEYRENFRHLRPRAAVILNVEPDHFDYYADRAAVEAAFARFANQIDPAGELIVSVDCPAALRIARAHAEKTGTRLTTFAIETSADWQTKNLEHSVGMFAFDLHHLGEDFGRVRLAVPGKHNVANALAAAALAFAAGASSEAILAGIGHFSGLKRRMEQAGMIAGIPWIDDFAHHPSEITAALATVRQMFPGGRLWCVFQPHQVSRTTALLDEFACSLQNTDTVFVTDIYRAREGLARPGEVGPADLAERIRAAEGNSPAVHSTTEIEKLLAKAIANQELGPHDVLVTLGAGNVERIAHGLIQRFREYRAAG
jgi:UDP-N-acetylmuramate--alanine ligase